MCTRAAVTGLVLVMLAGCGGGGGAKANGEQDKPAQQIVKDAAAALGAVHSFHAGGSQTDSDGVSRVTVDVVLPGKMKVHAIQGDKVVDAVILGNDAYLRGNRAFWQSLGAGTAALSSRLADKWLKSPGASAQFGNLATLSDPSLIGRCTMIVHRGPLTKAGSADVDGKSTVVVEDSGDGSDSAPGKAYIATQGDPLPVRLVQSGPYSSGATPDAQCKETKDDLTTTASDLHFSNWNGDIKIEPPKGAIDISQAAGGSSS